MPHVPLKVLRGKQDDKDIQDEYFERFQAPTTTTEDDENDNDSVRSNLSVDDIGEVSEEGMARYLGRDTDSMNSFSQSAIISDSEYLHNNQGNNAACQNILSVSHEAIELQVLAQVHLPPNIDNDNDTDGWKTVDSTSWTRLNT